MKYYVGIDNGVTGSIGIIKPDGTVDFYRTPVKKFLGYQKEEHHVTRVDAPKLKEILSKLPKDNVSITMERPMVNPGRFTASLSAIRALEATLIVMEDLGLEVKYIDSKEWQRAILPEEISGEELKAASLDIGTKLFPTLANKFKSDADAMLIAEHVRRKENK